jgi:hypothetical protein
LAAFSTVATLSVSLRGVASFENRLAAVGYTTTVLGVTASMGYYSEKSEASLSVGTLAASIAGSTLPRPGEPMS